MYLHFYSYITTTTTNTDLHANLRAMFSYSTRFMLLLFVFAANVNSCNDACNVHCMSSKNSMLDAMPFLNIFCVKDQDDGRDDYSPMFI